MLVLFCNVQKRGIGRQLVRRLVLAVAERAKRGGDDGPDAFAVFPPPERREFFRCALAVAQRR